MGFKGYLWAVPGAAAGVFENGQEENSCFRALCPPKKLVLGVLFISEGCIMKEKARRSSSEVNEMRYITILICSCHLANF